MISRSDASSPPSAALHAVELTKFTPYSFLSRGGNRASGDGGPMVEKTT